MDDLTNQEASFGYCTNERRCLIILSLWIIMVRFLYLYLALYQISSWTHEYWSQRHHIKYFDWFSLQVYLNNIKNISMGLLKLLLIYFIPYSSLSNLSRCWYWFIIVIKSKYATKYQTILMSWQNLCSIYTCYVFLKHLYLCCEHSHRHVAHVSPWLRWFEHNIF